MERTTEGGIIRRLNIWDSINKFDYRPGYTVIAHVSSYHRNKNDYHIPGHEHMLAYTQPEFPSELDQGFVQSSEDREDAKEVVGAGIQPVLLAIQQSSLLSVNVHFITFRNNLNKILNTPYNRNSPWEIGAQRLNHPYFGHCICLHVIHKNETQSTQQQQWCYWGRKFEELCTKISSVEEGLDNEYCTISLSKLGNYRLLIAAEIDCYHSKPESKSFSVPIQQTKFSPADFIELKTNRLLDEKRGSSFYKYKLRSVWIQSMLAGVPTIIFGFRDDNGILKNLKTYKTEQLPRISKDNGGNWDPACCIRFGHSLLDLLYNNVKDNQNYILEYIPQQHSVQLQESEQKFPDLSFFDTITQTPTNCSCSVYSIP